MSHYSYPRLCHITHTLNCVPVIAFSHSLYWIQFKVNYIVNNCEYAIQTNQLKGPISFRWNISFKTKVQIVKLPICNTCLFYCCMLDSLSIWIMLQLTTACYIGQLTSKSWYNLRVYGQNKQLSIWFSDDINLNNIFSRFHINRY